MKDLYRIKFTHQETGWPFNNENERARFRIERRTFFLFKWFSYWTIIAENLTQIQAESRVKEIVRTEKEFEA